MKKTYDLLSKNTTDIFQGVSPTQIVGALRKVREKKRSKLTTWSSCVGEARILVIQRQNRSP